MSLGSLRILQTDSARILEDPSDQLRVDPWGSFWLLFTRILEDPSDQLQVDPRGSFWLLSPGSSRILLTNFRWILEDPSDYFHPDPRGSFCVVSQASNVSQCSDSMRILKNTFLCQSRRLYHITQKTRNLEALKKKQTSFLIFFLLKGSISTLN